MTISAHVVAHSASPEGKEIVSIGVTAHRFILAEINTHRKLSRSYRSSRAVPSKKLIEEVRTNPAMPVFWGANEKGMQASGELANEKDGLDLVAGQTEEQHTGWGGEFINSSPLERAQFAWRAAAKDAANSATDMAKYGLHKQIANRVLEPFLWVHGIITATEWENFFGLRLHAAAQPEFRALADAMWAAMKESKPKVLEPGQWHLPFVGDDEYDLSQPWKPGDDPIRVSVARCARSSYASFETGKRSTLDEDLALYEKLVGAQPIHASPAEHQATPTEPGPTSGSQGFCLDCGNPAWDYQEQCGNFVGWRQYRKMLPGEAVAPLPPGYA